MHTAQRTETIKYRIIYENCERNKKKKKRTKNRIVENENESDVETYTCIIYTLSCLLRRVKFFVCKHLQKYFESPKVFRMTNSTNKQIANCKSKIVKH